MKGDKGTTPLCHCFRAFSCRIRNTDMDLLEFAGTLLGFDDYVSMYITYRSIVTLLTGH